MNPKPRYSDIKHLRTCHLCPKIPNEPKFSVPSKLQLPNETKHGKMQSPNVLKIQSKLCPKIVVQNEITVEIVTDLGANEFVSLMMIKMMKTTITTGITKKMSFNMMGIKMMRTSLQCKLS